MKLIVKVITKFLTGLINVVLFPIDSIIDTMMPSLSTALGYINSFFDYIIQFANWVLSWLPFNPEVLSFLVLGLLFCVNLSLTIEGVKIAVKWWHALAP